MLYVVAGEASGDARGAELLAALVCEMPGLQIYGAGGPKMREFATGSFSDWTEEAVVGIWEVLKKWGYFRREMERMLSEIEVLQPKVLLLVDYPGFNLRLAKAVKARWPQIATVFYISPQVWAWNRGRIPKMACYLDLMLCIFPFEKDLYEASGLHTEFVGHPMLDSLAPLRSNIPRSEHLVGLFPGSRDREVRRLFPVMLEAARLLSATQPGLRFEAAAANVRQAAWMLEHLGERRFDPSFCRVAQERFYTLAQEATAGMVCSGTATLEAAYFGLPMLITYKVSAPTWVMGKLLVRIPFLGMPNVIAGREVAPEFLQKRASPRRLARAMAQLLEKPRERLDQQAAFTGVIAKLGQPGAGRRAALAVAKMLRS
ncbi:MAG: lipid-A-disaccharide synthase [Verrucomicrobia bacterium]|nr:lipid-A-disaccharide synthase [Verrucomicrobiota bacterium]